MEEAQAGEINSVLSEPASQEKSSSHGTRQLFWSNFTPDTLRAALEI